MSKPELMYYNAAVMVTVVPLSYEDHGGFHYRIMVECTDFAANRWAVRNGGSCLSSQGTWDYEPFVSSRTDEWLEEHRFPLEVALRLAGEQAAKLKVNGKTPEQFMEYIDRVLQDE